VDNFPFPLIQNLLVLSSRNSDIKDIAVGVDVREKEFLKEIDRQIAELKRQFNVNVLFLEADTEVLLRRYKETRRPHPLQSLTDSNLQKALEMEKEILLPLKEVSDLVIDTSSYSPHQLREFIIQRFGTPNLSRFTITLVSFGYKFGTPQNIDLLFDIRFLPNPYFVEELKPLTGLEPKVREFVLNSSVTNEFLQKVKELLRFLIPQYMNEGKTNLIIGIGCTGGKHRSPVIVRELEQFISKELKTPVVTVHREL
jgi:UPF0042 nucleotide-binding protein